MSDSIRLCSLVPGGLCLAYCSNLDKQTNTCRRSSHPPKRWGHGVTVIEIPASEWQQGERGGGESEIVEPTIGRPTEHASSYRPTMDGASIEELSRALDDLND